MSNLPPIKGRGAQSNPGNRFEVIKLERDIDWNPEEDPAPRTQFLRDSTKTFIAYNDSPDVGFNAGINVYRGCEHGCIYCFARPFHEYLGFSAGLDFESRIMVKEDGPQLLRKELSSPKWKPQVLGMSGVTDCYQPAERRFGLTRKCLEVLAEFKNPVCIITKNFLVTRDIDILQTLAAVQAVSVNISVTTLDPTLTPRMEPRASLPAHRLEAIRQLSSAGVPVGLLMGPVIPGLTDHEMPAIVSEAVSAGASFAGYVPLRLPYGLKTLFEDWLTQHFPDRKDKVLNRIRQMRGGRLYDSTFGKRMEGEGIFAEQISRMFEVSCRKAGLKEENRPVLSTAAFRVPTPGGQLDLFSS